MPGSLGDRGWQPLFLPLGLAVVGLPHPDSTFPRGGGPWYRQFHLVLSPTLSYSFCAFSVVVPDEECLAIMCHPSLAAPLGAAAINFVGAGTMTPGCPRLPPVPCRCGVERNARHSNTFVPSPPHVHPPPRDDGSPPPRGEPLPSDGSPPLAGGDRHHHQRTNYRRILRRTYDRSVACCMSPKALKCTLTY